jgi:uncharacterized membrane protein YecN with MAPEG domain
MTPYTGQNFGEYAPTGLFLLFLLESQKLVKPATLCTIGSALALTRILHAFSLSCPQAPLAVTVRPAGESLCSVNPECSTRPYSKLEK